LSERRYGHYVRGAREPDFGTLLRICSVLDVTPNDLLLPVGTPKPRERERSLSRLAAAGRKLSPDDLKLAVRQIEVLADYRGARAK
jgi:transcriptional regulator with XRE-family HTH domain